MGGSCNVETGSFTEVIDGATRRQAGAIQPTEIVDIWDNLDCLGICIVVMWHDLPNYQSHIFAMSMKNIRILSFSSYPP